MGKSDTALDRPFDRVFSEWNRPQIERDAKWQQAFQDQDVEGIAAYAPMGIWEQKDWESDRADAMIQSCITANHVDGYQMGYGDFARLVGYAGRIYGPRCLYVLHHFGVLKDKAYRKAVPTAWSLAEYPSQSLSNTDWRTLWLKAGFTVDHKAAERPTEPITVWRGAFPKFKRGFSWTDDMERAKWFVQARGSKSRLYTATVPPERLFARIHDVGRHEDEWVVDTRALKIEEVILVDHD